MDDLIQVVHKISEVLFIFLSTKAIYLCLRNSTEIPTKFAFFHSMSCEISQKLAILPAEDFILVLLLSPFFLRLSMPLFMHLSRSLQKEKNNNATKYRRTKFSSSGHSV